MAHSDRTAFLPLRRLLLAATLILVVSIGPAFRPGAASAAASPPLAPAPFSSVEEEWEEEPGEWEVEDDEEEWEVGEEVEVEGEGDSGWEVSGERGHREAPEGCMLYRASARVVASERGDTVSLDVDYTSGKATTVKVEYWLKGSRGAMQMKSLRRHMARRGSLHAVERLSTHEMSKVHAARAFVVDLEMAGVPSSCERYCTRHLTARQRRGGSTVWSEPARGAQGY